MLRSPEGHPPHLRSTKSMRHIVAALAVPVLLFTAACGSDEDGGKDSAPESKVEVSGKFGEKPTISSPKGAKAPSKLVIDTHIEGSGEKVGKGDFVRLDFAGQAMKNKQNLGGTWETAEKAGGKGPRRQLVARMGQPSQELPPKVLDAVIGQKVGSRVEVSGTAKALIGAQLNPQSGLSPKDGLVFVIDVVGSQKLDAKSTAEGTEEKPAEGLPTVKDNGQKAATITVPKGVAAPKELKDHVLIKGDGPKVKAGEGLIAQYTGVKWEDGKKFDSSWDHGGATAFQIGTGSVVKGWDVALADKRVGDRVELVIPPKLAYGQDPQSELAKNTLVFVVDIVGKV